LGILTSSSDVKKEGRGLELGFPEYSRKKNVGSRRGNVVRGRERTKTKGGGRSMFMFEDPNADHRGREKNPRIGVILPHQV